MARVLVTGAGRGIGLAVVERMAAAGWDVLAGARSEADRERLAATPGGRVRPVELDVCDEAHVAALARAAAPSLDAVVNNAGIVVAGPLEALAPEDVRRQLEVNVVAQMAVTQAVLPALRAARGRVLFVSSVTGRVSSPHMGAYAASKFALEGAADAMRVELRPWGVHVVLIEPGSTDTDLWRNAQQTVEEVEAGMRPVHRELYEPQLRAMRRLVGQVQRRTSAVEKVADAVERALTASRPRARYVVGADARLQLALRALLPTRALDRMLAAATGAR